MRRLSNPLLLTILIASLVQITGCSQDDHLGLTKDKGADNTTDPITEPDSNNSGETPDVARETPTSPGNKHEASSFLTKATFGSTQASINDLLNKNYATWLDGQFNAAPTYQLPNFTERLIANGYEQSSGIENSFHRRLLRNDTWWDIVINAEDQLRQRMAFALSEILVVSELDATLKHMPRGVASYNDVLVEHAFGNFRNLLKAVTLHPMMGDYLSMRRNEKASSDGTIQPDENFAREIMQLFTIGLHELNIDGTVKLDSAGDPIPTYDQVDIKNFARVFTGWNYGDAQILRSNERTVTSQTSPMKPFQEYHDTDSKVLLDGVSLVAGQTAEQDLDLAIDNLFNHSNTAPFISKHLIQRFVTSNPSPAYVERVALIFNDNGEGVRGDLKSVIKAILLDEDAFFGALDEPETFGKVKEPLLMLSHLFRAFSAKGEDYGYIRLANTLEELGQQPLGAPTVFNFFKPGFSQPGPISEKQLLSPEMQIISEATTTSIHNILYQIIFGVSAFAGELNDQHTVTLDLSYEETLAEDPSVLVEHYNTLLFSGRLSSSTKDKLIEYLSSSLQNTNEELKVRDTLFLLATSPAFSIQQ